MAVLKCKMCGGDLPAAEDGQSVVECEYCGSRQTIPTADNEKKITLFGRAGRLLRACEFDKAAGIFENIVAEFPEEAEAYWGLVLCKFGIEYVDDPATGEKVPTCHRSSFDSVMKDDNFEQACENADEIARRQYRSEAKVIENLRRRIIEVSASEEPYDIFISYKETDCEGQRTLDSVIAQDIYDALTNKGYRVFFSRISLEDKLGVEYEPYIFAALNSAKLMLSVGTDYENFEAVWVKNEWSRFLALIAAGQKKVLIPCFKNIDAYDMPKEFAKLAAQDMGKVGAMQDLLRGIDKIMGGEKPKEEKKETVVIQQTSAGPNAEALLKRGNMALEDGEWEKANGFFEEVLNFDAECAEAYLGKALAAKKIISLEAVAATVDFSIFELKDLEKAQRFGSESLLKEIDNTKTSVVENIREAERIRNGKNNKLSLLREKIKKVHNIFSAGFEHTVGLCSDGTVLAVGYNEYGRCNVECWTDIVSVSAGDCHTVGLKSDGTVIAAGAIYAGQCDVEGWKDIVAVSAGDDHTVGLKSDGTVLAVGYNEYGQCNVESWKDIVDISAGKMHTVGLCSDGTVVAVGNNISNQCNVKSWKDIFMVSAGDEHTVAIRMDGTVLATGNNEYGQCDVSDWKDILYVSAGGYHTVGVCADGSVLAVGANDLGRCDVKDWKEILAVSAGYRYTLGLHPDGTVVSVGDHNSGQCNVAGWKLFDSFENFEAERKEKMTQATEWRSQGLCQHCGGELKGFFTKKCTSCGRTKDY